MKSNQPKTRANRSREALILKRTFTVEHPIIKEFVHCVRAQAKLMTRLRTAQSKVDEIATRYQHEQEQLNAITDRIRELDRSTALALGINTAYRERKFTPRKFKGRKQRQVAPDNVISITRARRVA